MSESCVFGVAHGGGCEAVWGWVGALVRYPPFCSCNWRTRVGFNFAVFVVAACVAQSVAEAAAGSLARESGCAGGDAYGACLGLHFADCGGDGGSSRAAVLGGSE